jgi:hypothetical protein
LHFIYTGCPRELFTLGSQDHNFLNINFYAKFNHSVQTLWYNLAYEWLTNHIGPKKVV